MTLMKRKRHTPEQFVKKLRDAREELGRGKELGEVCRQLEVSEATSSFHQQVSGSVSWGHFNSTILENAKPPGSIIKFTTEQSHRISRLPLDFGSSS